MQALSVQPGKQGSDLGEREAEPPAGQNQDQLLAVGAMVQPDGAAA